MQTRALGGSDLEIPPIVLGGMFRDTVAREVELARALDCALDWGLTAVDTAPMYGFGESERLLGRLLAGRRARICLMTKVGIRWDDAWGDVLFEAELGGRRVAVRRDSRPEAVRRDVDESLARLRCESLDLVQVHHRDRNTPIAETMGELERLRDEGKLRAIGVSNFSPAELDEARLALGDVPLASTQNAYSLLERRPDRELLPRARAAGVGFLAYSPLAGGLLAGRLLDGPLPEGDWRSEGPLFQPCNVGHVNRALREVACPIAERAGVGLSPVALAWAIAKPGVSAAIVGAQSEAQVRGAAAATQLALTTAEQARLDQAFAALPLDRNAGIPMRRRAVAKLRRVARRILG